MDLKLYTLPGSGSYEHSQGKASPGSVTSGGGRDSAAARLKIERRKPNWTECENIFLLDQFSIHRDILTCKATDASTNLRKQEIWRTICGNLNKQNVLVRRTPAEVRRKWKNLVTAAKKELWEIRHSIQVTGINKKLSDLSSRVLQLHQGCSFGSGGGHGGSNGLASALNGLISGLNGGFGGQSGGIFNSHAAAAAATHHLLSNGGLNMDCDPDDGNSMDGYGSEGEMTPFTPIVTLSEDRDDGNHSSDESNSIVDLRVHPKKLSLAALGLRPRVHVNSQATINRVNVEISPKMKDLVNGGSRDSNNNNHSNEEEEEVKARDTRDTRESRDPRDDERLDDFDESGGESDREDFGALPTANGPGKSTVQQASALLNQLTQNGPFNPYLVQPGLHGPGQVKGQDVAGLKESLDHQIPPKKYLVTDHELYRTKLELQVEILKLRKRKLLRELMKRRAMAAYLLRGQPKVNKPAQSLNKGQSNSDTPRPIPNGLPNGTSHIKKRKKRRGKFGKFAKNKKIAKRATTEVKVEVKPVPEDKTNGVQ